MTTVETAAVDCGLCGSSDYREECRTLDFCYGTCSNSFSYVRCLACGHVYLRNRPVIAELSTIYPETYLTYDYEEHLGSFINGLRNHVQKLKIRPIQKYAEDRDVVLEVGCGGGDLLAALKKHGNPSWRLFGLDFSAEAVRALERRGIQGIQARLEDVTWEHDPVGVIVMNQLIEHVQDPLACLEKAYEMLRPGGVIIMETPSLEGWDAKLFRRRYWGGWHAPRHWNLFTAVSLAEAARQKGLEVAEVEYILSPFSWLHSLQYLIRDKTRFGRLARSLDVTNFISLCVASGLDVVQLLLRSKTSNMRLVARKPAARTEP